MEWNGMGIVISCLSRHFDSPSEARTLATYTLEYGTQRQWQRIAVQHSLYSPQTQLHAVYTVFEGRLTYQATTADSNGLFGPVRRLMHSFTVVYCTFGIIPAYTIKHQPIPPACSLEDMRVLLTAHRSLGETTGVTDTQQPRAAHAGQQDK